MLALAITGGFTVATCEKSMTAPITIRRNDLDGGSMEPGSGSAAKITMGPRLQEYGHRPQMHWYVDSDA